MSDTLPVPPDPAKPVSDQSPPSDNANLLRWIATSNPFYAVSAALVLVGLWFSFGQESDEMETWLYMSGLAGYTLLLAVTAFFLVRHLHLWDDARTVLLLVVLMFLACSVTFDHVLVLEPGRGTTCYLVGLALSVIFTEVLLRAIQLRLPPLYRLSYYLILALFFLYPLYVRSLLVPDNPMQEPVMWGLFGFSTAAGLVFLTLLPAIRRGADYVQNNGSPWLWPLYPLSLFVVMAIVVPGRAVLMCWSLHALGPTQFDRLIFAPYFLVPFVFALGILAVELGVVQSSKKVLQFVLWVPVILVILAVVGNHPDDPIYRMLRVLTTPLGSFRAFDRVRSIADPVHGAFLHAFAQRLGGDPLFITVILSACFYGYAALRRVPLATEGLSVALAALAVVDRDSMTEGLRHTAEPMWLLAPLLLQLMLGGWRRNAWHLLFAMACLAGMIALLAPIHVQEDRPLRVVVFLHVLLVEMLLLGALFKDTAGSVIRGTAAVGFLIFSFSALSQEREIATQLNAWAPVVYPLVLGLLLATYGQLIRDSFVMVVSTSILGFWVFYYGWTAYRGVRQLFKGLDFIVMGLSFFVVAVLVSLGKSGVLMRWIESRWGIPNWLQPAEPKPMAEIPMILPVEDESQEKPEE